MRRRYPSVFGKRKPPQRCGGGGECEEGKCEEGKCEEGIVSRTRCSALAPLRRAGTTNAAAHGSGISSAPQERCAASGARSLLRQPPTSALMTSPNRSHFSPLNFIS